MCITLQYITCKVYNNYLYNIKTHNFGLIPADYKQEWLSVVLHISSMIWWMFSQPACCPRRTLGRHPFFWLRPQRVQLNACTSLSSKIISLSLLAPWQHTTANWQHWPPNTYNPEHCTEDAPGCPQKTETAVTLLLQRFSPAQGTVHTDKTGITVTVASFVFVMSWRWFCSHVAKRHTTALSLHSWCSVSSWTGAERKTNISWSFDNHLISVSDAYTQFGLIWVYHWCFLRMSISFLLFQREQMCCWNTLMVRTLIHTH